MKPSKLIKSILIGVLLFSVLSCTDEKPESPIPEKLKPENSRQVNIVLDDSYDFTNYKAHTILDSIAFVNPDEKLFAPQGNQSILFFTDNESGEIMALVQLDSTSSEVRINLETVTAGVLSLAPMYTSLTNEQKRDLLQRIQSEESYSLLKGIVDEIMNNREPIFSDKPEFISQLLEVNSYILNTYFSDPQEEGGRINLGKEDFPSFVRNENGLTIFNQVSSYVFLNFISDSRGDSISHILEPKPLNPFGQSKIGGNTLGLKDDCYSVVINQSNGDVVSKNLIQMGTILTSAFLDAVIDIGIKGCAPGLTAKIFTKLGITLAGVENIPPAELLNEATLAVAEVVYEALKSGDCAILSNKAAIAKFVAAKSNLYVNLYKAVEFIYNASPAGPYAISLIPALRINLSKKLQIYEGNLVEACVQVVKASSLDQEYPAGEKVLVKIKLEPQPQTEYADWKKSGFKVSWDLPPLNGNLSEASTETDAEGYASVNWTMPNEPNAVPTLTAVIKDKEGDHIAGSPVVFQVKVSENPFETLILGKWELVKLLHSEGEHEFENPAVWEFMSGNKLFVTEDGTDYEANYILSGNDLTISGQGFEDPYPIVILMLNSSNMEFKEYAPTWSQIYKFNKIGN